MARRNNNSRETPPLSVVRGEQVKATYTDLPIPEYQGNPLIEALPPLWTAGEVEQMLSYFPLYDPEQRKLASEVRLHLLENAREFFIPQGIHYEIHLSISNMIRRGYIDRNPVSKGKWASQGEKIELLGNRLQRRAFLRSKARGMCIVGIGGVGKSSAVENILSLYPQVITHSNYKEQDLILKQIVWVKLQCPSDGSLRSLCISYIQEVDDILGTNYMNLYGASRRTVDDLLLIMARVASNQFQGVLVFDEIQDLSEAKSGGATRMLNFFVQLENTLGIPFILIGTPKAKELLSGEFRQARRVSEQGDIYWRPTREIAEKEKPNDPNGIDQDWNDFVRAMWKYWYLKKDHLLPADLLNEPTIRTLYRESKGITALVVTIFFLAQRRAITSGVENVTSSVITSAVKDNQHFVERAFEYFRGNQQGKGISRSVSDLDWSSWRQPKSTTTNRENPEITEIESKSGTITAQASTHAPKKDTPSLTKPKRNRKKSDAAATFENNDFRIIPTELKKTKSGEQQASINRFMGSTDEFS
jgi:hypothetical protein